MVTYGGLCLMSDELLCLTSILLREGKISENHAITIRESLAVYMFPITESECIPEFTDTVNIIADNLRGLV